MKLAIMVSEVHAWMEISHRLRLSLSCDASYQYGLGNQANEFSSAVNKTLYGF